jgi:mannosyl-oligosaccharide alpha-1,2-mannosidase
MSVWTIRRRPSRVALVVIVLVILLFWRQGLPFSLGLSRIDGIPFRKTSFDWATLRHSYPTSSIRPLPAGEPLRLPKVQYEFPDETAADREKRETRRAAVLNAFKRSWNSYRRYAWMQDELAPVAGKGKTTFGGLAATMVDSLDTLWIMGLRKEFKEAVRAVALIDWNDTAENALNMFETTIRHLGGLLSAYDLSHERALLAKAVELGDMLYTGFDTENRMPPFWFDFAAAKGGFQRVGNRDSSAAGCSLSLEFTRLSQLTGNPKYFDAAENVKQLLYRTQNQTKLPGMWPAYLNYRLETASDNFFSIGAQADSLYEYLVKMHALLGGLDPEYVTLSVGALERIKESILFRPMIPGDEDILFPGNAYYRSEDDTDLQPDPQHLGCFAGGMYGLAGKILEMEGYIEIGEQATRGCVWAYQAFPTGIMPEVFRVIACGTKNLERCDWNETRWDIEGSRGMVKGFKDIRDQRYLLRPEAIESVFYMYRITGKQEYQDMAWTMFESIVKATETPLAYSSISNVNVEGKTFKLDSMEVSHKHN